MERKIMLALTLLLSGRAMTLAFLSRVGGSGAGDPPAAWLMPLVGDAVIGVTALFVAYLIWKKSGLWVWVTVIVWNALAIWDAFSAYLVHLSNPWPEFFMIQIFGSLMFFAAAGMHAMILYLATRPKVQAQMV